jgi:hypothetical protein
MKLLHHQAHQLLLQMCSQVKQMNGDDVRDAVFMAVSCGIVEFIDEILKVDDTLVSVTDAMGREIIYHAVLYRQAKVYRRIYEEVENNWIKQVSISDKSGNTLLHMTAMLEPSTTRDHIAGEALKMQSELQWFKVISLILYFSDMLILRSLMFDVILNQKKFLLKPIKTFKVTSHLIGHKEDFNAPSSITHLLMDQTYIKEMTYNQ